MGRSWSGTWRSRATALTLRMLARRLPSGCRRRSCRCLRSSTRSPRERRGRSTARHCPGRPPARRMVTMPVPGPRRGCRHTRLAGPHVARDPGRAHRGRRRLLCPRRQQPGHGDAGVCAARAPPHDRGFRHLPRSTLRELAAPSTVRAGAARRRTGRGARPGCGPPWCSSRSSWRPSRAGLRWALGLALLHNLVEHAVGPPAGVTRVVVGDRRGFLVLLSAPGNLLVTVAGVRFLRLGVKPGSHPRGGRVHLQLWACERLISVFGSARSVAPAGPRLRPGGRLPRRTQRRPADPRARHGMVDARVGLRGRARDRPGRLVDRG